jgi:Myb-like DNA-binding domain
MISDIHLNCCPRGKKKIDAQYSNFVKRQKIKDINPTDEKLRKLVENALPFFENSSNFPNPNEENKPSYRFLFEESAWSSEEESAWSSEEELAWSTGDVALPPLFDISYTDEEIASPEQNFLKDNCSRISPIAGAALKIREPSGIVPSVCEDPISQYVNQFFQHPEDSSNSSTLRESFDTLPPLPEDPLFDFSENVTYDISKFFPEDFDFSQFPPYDFGFSQDSTCDFSENDILSSTFYPLNSTDNEIKYLDTIPSSQRFTIASQPVEWNKDQDDLLNQVYENYMNGYIDKVSIEEAEKANEKWNIISLCMPSHSGTQCFERWMFLNPTSRDWKEWEIDRLFTVVKNFKGDDPHKRIDWNEISQQMDNRTRHNCYKKYNEVIKQRDRARENIKSKK